MNVVKDDRWLNKTDNISIDPDYACIGSLTYIVEKHSKEKDAFFTELKKQMLQIIG